MTSVPPIVKPRSSLLGYGRELHRQFPLVWKLARYQMQADVSDTRLGPMWLLVSPLLVALPSIVVFGYLLEIDRGVTNYPLFSMIGLLTFRILSKTWTRTARTFRPRGRPNIPDGVPVPIGVAAFAIHETLLGAVGLMVCLLWAVSTQATTSSAMLLIPAFIASFAIANGIGLVIASLARSSADLAEALPHVTRALGYASGIWFAPAAYASGRWFGPLFDWNPISVLIEFYRIALIGFPMRPVVGVSVLVGAGLSNVVGLLLLWRTRRFP